MRLSLVVLIAVLAALMPGAALADSPDEKGGFVLRVNGDYAVSTGESIRTLVVIRGDATVDGTVTDALVVIDGDATVRGTVEDNITVVRGSLTLEQGARVKNIQLIRSDLNLNSGASVTGDIERSSFRWVGGALIILGVLLWLGMTVVVLVAGLVFAAIGGKQLGSAAAALTASPGESILGAVIAVVAIPIAAVIAMVTVVGLPVGLGVLLFLLPALLFLGYIVTGVRLGSLMLNRSDLGEPASHPYLAAVLGLLVLQVALLIPVVGAVAFVLAGPWGAGGLVLVAWRGLREKPAVTLAPGPSQAPPAFP